MKNKLLLITILLLFSVNLSATEIIYSFKSEIKVLESSDLIITETIKVKAEGQSIKRGIYRAIPNTYKTKSGAKFKVKYEVLEILRDGVSENYHTKSENGYSYIYIGNRDYFLPNGDYTFTIKYKTNKQIGYYKDFDELYWNVNGVEWSFPIKKIEAIIYLPTNAKIQNFKAYTGKWGEAKDDFRSEKLAENVIRFENTKEFEANENMSVAVSWQKGIVHQPNFQEKSISFFEDNMVILIGFFGVLFSFLIHLYNWKKVGVDPPKGTVIPLFKPPNGLSPSAMRYILKMSVDNKAYTAALVSMATKGAINIAKKGSTYHIIKKTGADNIELSKSEKTIFNGLFTTGNVFKMSNSNHNRISSSIRSFMNAEKELHKETYFKLNRKFLIAGLVFSVLTVLATFLLRGIEFEVSSLTSFLPFVFFIVFAFMNTSTAQKNTVGIIAGIIFVIMFFVFSSSGTIGFSSFEFIVLVVVVLILIFINLLFAYLMKAPTLFGRKEMDKIEGFKMYLKTAEEDRLDAQNIPDKTPELFEKYLPYAIALDCENKWAKKFKSIIDKAIQDGTYTQPSWYIGRNTVFNPNRFTNDISQNFNSSIASSSVAPSQRGSGGMGGSGGGGFSGGGGGGGGGGGW